jgi:hypothetical protein
MLYRVPRAEEDTAREGLLPAGDRDSVTRRELGHGSGQPAVVPPTPRSLYFRGHDLLCQVRGVLCEGTSPRTSTSMALTLANECFTRHDRHG